MNQQNLTNKSVRAFIVPLESWAVHEAEFNTSLFHHPEWLDAMQDSDHQPVYLEFCDNQRMIALLSGLICKGNWLQGIHFYAYSGISIIENNLELYQACHTALFNLAKKMHWDRIVIGSYDQQHTMACAAPGFFVTHRKEYVVAPCKNGDAHQFSTGFRKNYKKAVKIGTTFHQSNQAEILDRLFELLESTHCTREKKYHAAYNPFYLKNMSKETIKKLWATNLIKLYYTLNEHTVHSVQLNLEHRQKVYGLLMGSDEFAYHNGLPSLIDTELIKQFSNQEFKYYNTGGTPQTEGGKGLEQYKRYMGALPVDYYGCTTNYLTFPRQLLNPLMNAGRKMPQADHPILNGIKKLLYR